MKIVAAALMLLLAACAPRLQLPGPMPGNHPALNGDHIVTSDGLALPLRVWQAEGEEKAVFLGVHGFGDYSNGFAMPAPWWAKQGITTYAYDQRGFGASPQHGFWPGVDRLVGDLRDTVRLLRSRHPDVPLFLVGDSMGGAVAMAAMADVKKGDRYSVDGLILNAPAVWGRSTMNPIYRATLWLAAHTMPWNHADGRGLGIRPSDNIDMLRALGRDPLTYKRSRIDVVYGLVNLMDAGLAASARLRLPVLLLYGARDEIIPRKPVEAMLSKLAAPHRVVLYPDGWHMLFRDVQRKVVWRDVAAWALDPAAPLPSGFERNGGPLFAEQ